MTYFPYMWLPTEKHTKTYIILSHFFQLANLSAAIHGRTLWGTLLSSFLKERRCCGLPQQCCNVARWNSLPNCQQKCCNITICVINTTHLPHRHSGTRASASATVSQPCCWISRTQVFCSSVLCKVSYLESPLPPPKAKLKKIPRMATGGNHCSHRNVN